MLGITVTRSAPGHTVAELRTGPEHANPHGTVHGAVFYAVAGAAIAAAANDETRSGIITSVLVEYLLPVQVGEVLRAEVAPAVVTPREEVFVARLLREPGSGGSGDAGAEPDLVAWARARGTRRTRAADTGGD